MAAIEGKWYASVGTHPRSSYPEDDATVRWVYATQPNGEKYVVAKVWAGDDGDFEGTARLAASAPELLAALKEGLHQLENSTGKHNLSQLFRAAINKAEGRVE
jgi:hypothetical protein